MSSQREEDLIHTFNGITFSTRSSLELLKSLDTFDAREDDVLLVSYPKSGFRSWSCAIDLSPNLECMPSYLLPYHELSFSAIYIIRNPKDTAVSMYHYYRENPNLPTIDTWPAFLEMFLKGDVVCGSWFDHILSWEEHRNDKNILLLFYEDMKKDLPKVVKKMCLFLGVNIGDGEVKEVCKKSSFSEMKNNTEKENRDPSHTVCTLTSNRKLIFRKGAVGDWKNHFTPKQNRSFEEAFNKKMKCSEVAKHIVYES
uniref:Sulfotransferase n=1 Tax=Sphenodon punctatus TaxID=8508 RepID=A0A8D0HUW9_SPHPU